MLNKHLNILFGRILIPALIFMFASCSGGGGGDSSSNNSGNSTTISWYKDADGDGYSDGTTMDRVDQPAGYYTAGALTSTRGDCDDNDNTVHPGATETCGDGIDQDCNDTDLICVPGITTYVYENFNNGAGGFVETSYFFALNGYYAYRGELSNGYFTIWNGGSNPSSNLNPQSWHSNYFDDFNVSADTYWDAGSSSAFYGLVMCVSKNSLKSNYDYDDIEFLITKDGRYLIDRKVNNNYEILSYGRTYLLSIDGQQNRISVENKSNRFRFYINDVEVENLDIDAPTGGGLGVFGDSMLDVDFDNFTVTTPYKDALVLDSPDYVMEQKRMVQKVMTTTYLWYDKVPDVDLADYASPEELLEDLIYKELDEWSYIVTKDEYNNLVIEGKYIGIGFGYDDGDNDVLSVRFVYRDSPADQSGLIRGDRIRVINGKTIPEIENDDLWETIFGEDEIGVPVDITVENSEGVIRDIHMIKTWVTMNAVLHHEILQFNGKKIGYLVFQRFLTSAREELDAVFEIFKQQEIDSLILDLRYNPGGFSNIARYLSELIAGSNAAGEIFMKTKHNDKYSVWDGVSIFDTHENGLNLDKVMIITTESTCSASEMMMNSLKPFIDVSSVGSTTCGKPVGMYGHNLLEKHISPIEVKMVNSEDEGDYYDGIPPTCSADDDMTRQFGDIEEDSLREALDYITSGFCTPRIKSKTAIPRKKIPLTGFRREIGAF